MNVNIELFAVAVYVVILLTIGFLSYRRHSTSSDFIIGGRSLNFWLTAFAAHASDMSSWLFMGYPAVIFSVGLFNSWVAIGLILFMYLNWQFVAPRVRIVTEQYQSLTLSSFFESRFADTSGTIRLFTGIMSLVFYCVYISVGLMSLGLLINALFGINYIIAITAGILIIIPYLFIGGYVTLAWTDLFQALFLLAVIAFVPLYALGHVGGIEGVKNALVEGKRTFDIVPNYSLKTLIQIVMLACGWGLGYFGQPHIITKFMGIRDVRQMSKSKYVGMSWMIITLGCATFIGLLGVAYFKGGLGDPSLVFIDMVHSLFPGFLGAFILCAILAATVSTVDSQILVLASVIAEDFYKRIFKKNASSREVLLVSRLSIFFVAATAYVLALFQFNTIFALVSYAWYGLGSSFGPLLIMTLYSNAVNRYGAWAGILVGGTVSGLWPLVSNLFPIPIPGLVPGFSLSLLAIWITSHLTRHKHITTHEH